MVGGERDIVTTGAIAITAAIGTDASGRAYPDSIGVNQEKPRHAGKSVQLCDWAMLPAPAADW
jgi:hypothetical protein